MQASELIKELEDYIKANGDLPIYKYAEYEEGYTSADIEIDYLDLREEQEIDEGRRGKTRKVLIPKRIVIS